MRFKIYSPLNIESKFIVGYNAFFIALSLRINLMKFIEKFSIFMHLLKVLTNTEVQNPLLELDIFPL
jgi:hypothetical protein